MNKNELYLRFTGLSTDELEKRLAKYSDILADMTIVDDLETVLDSKEVIETILKEREGGAK